MNADEQRALSALRLNWAPTPDDVWRSAPFHVDGLQRDVMRTVLDGVHEARDTTESSPIGVAILGQRGTGKTHLLGAVRERVQAEGGYFFLISLLETSAFWRSTALSVLDGLDRPVDGGESQLAVFLNRLVDVVGAPRSVRRAVTGLADLNRPSLDAFVDLIRKHNRQVGIDAQDTARALALRAAESSRAQDIGYEFLCSNDEEEAGDRATWGMRRGKRSAQEVVRDISRLLALTGPSVLAVDQIDLLISQSAKATNARSDRAVDWQQALLLEQIAGGLMSLRETTRRSLSVVTCLPQTWTDIITEATDTVQDRFREAAPLRRIPTPELARELIERRFAPLFAAARFTPPYPSWPVRPEAFALGHRYTPRELLRTVDTHVRACLATEQVTELTRLDAQDTARTEPAARPVPARASSTDLDLDGVDTHYAELIRQADPHPAVHKDTEDAVVPALLTAGLTAWIAEQGDAAEQFSIDPQAGGKPTLHGRLRRSLNDTDEDASAEDEEHWAFRAVSSPHHIAILNRVRNAVTTAGLTKGVQKRRLILLRNLASNPWGKGIRTREVIRDFDEAGGVTLPFEEADIRRLTALRELLAKHGPEALLPWFRSRRPAATIGVLQEALATVAPAAPTTPDTPAPAPPPKGETRTPSADARSVPVGKTVDGGQTVALGLEAFRRHIAIFAGSGSGKTVLIRRLVEECALRGVSAIVLDPNNDLARLGDPWPVPPDAWTSDDRRRSEEYLRETEVVVWTPNRVSGRPLSFQPLPDFADILDDTDAFEAGIDAALAALAPHAKVDGKTDKAVLGRAVLREALIGYARNGGNSLTAFIGALADLPEDVSRIADAPKLAGRMAQLLRAETVNDRMFGGDGAPADPGDLLTPSPGFRARVSVINFAGLPDDQQRQNFVNQLQIGLFAWIKRHPAGDRPLGGLFVMDEAQTLAPSGAMTPCTHSTLALASQARKYGLGLIFATQQPKGLHNAIPGNAATQFFGLLNSPAQINAAQEMARAKGSAIADVGRLRTGQFYATIESASFVKVQSPLCLTHHPKSPLSGEEVVERAARGPNHHPPAGAGHETPL
ncbi:ATP-binding protein [Actinoplanes sp. NBRC 101535]|uniref:ATP-binding protein n=1 Tax=Actinoplanes sp. NBRC 101535 TaxID=3032196 RepID=UPI0024A43A91|nr:ATP-binding protein [Actinoplanes sp. NBRC 101535]GLY06919.1 ATPase [Actinoplanes sp. NBRC 101535]